jgi:hypothetical protein
MNISEAVNAMLEGHWVRRLGWNGKGMHLYMEGAEDIPNPHVDQKTGKILYGTPRMHEAYFVLFTAKGTHQPGWNASTQDLLAGDWEVVPEDEME